MKLSKNHIFIIASAVIVTLFALIFIIHSNIERDLLKHRQKDWGIVGKPSVIQSDKALLKRISNPGKFNIISTKTSQADQSQILWDYQTKSAVVKSKIVETLEENQNFKGVQEDSSHYAMRLERIDARIKFYQNQLDADPKNEELISQINDLQHMRSIVLNLKDAVIIKDLEK